jgi:uncharacterized Zn-finger protein
MFTEINPAPNRERQTVQIPRQSQRRESMPADVNLKFRNDLGVREICIGVREFKCIGESPPQDHPHIYINMDGADAIRCPLLRDAVPPRSSIDTARCRATRQFVR